MIIKKSAAVIVVTLLIACLVPLIFFSESRQADLKELIQGNLILEQKSLAAVAVVSLFALDIFLPVPSSAVCAVAGRVFGVPLGIVLCWIGLNLAACIGYGLAYYMGWPLVRRLTDKEDLKNAKRFVDHWGAWPLLAMRPVPVLSEATILLMGIYRYPAARFWPPVMVGNLIVAVTFVWLGRWFSDQGQFWLGLLVCCLIPTVSLGWWLLHRRR